MIYTNQSVSAESRGDEPSFAKATAGPLTPRLRRAKQVGPRPTKPAAHSGDPPKIKIPPQQKSRRAKSGRQDSNLPCKYFIIN